MALCCWPVGRDTGVWSAENGSPVVFISAGDQQAYLTYRSRSERITIAVSFRPFRVFLCHHQDLILVVSALARLLALNHATGRAGATTG
jgi:hypothetical protein